VSVALELTARVEAAIEAGDWQLAQELEAERRRVLEELAAQPHAGAGLAATFTSLAARNQRLIGLVEHEQRRLLREAAGARSAEAGAAAYAELGAAADAVSAGM
jgi:hypothetical protein